MQAYQLIAWQRAPEFREVAVPRPGPGQVLVKVGGAGACHSDLHLTEFPPGALPWDPPFTIGHENAGWIEELGPGVTGWNKGDPVLVYGPWGCGRCRTCLSGFENYCERSDEVRAAGGGLGRDGGMASYMLVPQARWLVPLPRGLDPHLAAPLADAALTPYHAVKAALPALEGGGTAVVIGAGGLGQMGVQLLRELSAARVVAIDTNLQKRAAAKELGAELALAPGDDAVTTIRDVTRQQGAEVILDMVGAQGTLELATKIARKRGRISIVGLGGGALPVSFFSPPYECAVSSTYWGTLPELFEVVALAEAGRIKLEVETYPLARAPEVYERLREGKVRGRAVITPNG